MNKHKRINTFMMNVFSVIIFLAIAGGMGVMVGMAAVSPTGSVFEDIVGM